MFKSHIINVVVLILLVVLSSCETKSPVESKSENQVLHKLKSSLTSSVEFDRCDTYFKKPAPDVDFRLKDNVYLFYVKVIWNNDLHQSKTVYNALTMCFDLDLGTGVTPPLQYEVRVQETTNSILYTLETGVMNEFDDYFVDRYHDFSSHIVSVTPSKTITNRSYSIPIRILQPDKFDILITVQKDGNPSFMDTVVDDEDVLCSFDNWDEDKTKEFLYNYTFPGNGDYTLTYKLQSKYFDWDIENDKVYMAPIVTSRVFVRSSGKPVD